MKTVQYKIYPTKKQARLIKSQLEIHKTCYNKALALKQKYFTEQNVSLGWMELRKLVLPEFKKTTNHNAIANTIRRLDRTYRNFFKGRGFPRFKSKLKTIEYIYDNGIKFKTDNKIYIQYIGNVKFISHELIPNNIKTVLLTYKNDEFIISVIYTEDVLSVLSNTNTTNIGIDFGTKTTITLSSGTKIYTPNFIGNKIKEIKKAHRKNKQSVLNKIYKKISNQRRNFNHHTSKYIVQNFNIICIEDLNITSILSFNNSNRKLYNNCIGQLKKYISYKAESAGKTVVLVNPAYTTQTCSECLKVKFKTLNERIHDCSCGLKIDRDVNAAKNILRLGLQSLSQD